jgi:hypothetical protein
MNDLVNLDLSPGAWIKYGLGHSINIFTLVLNRKMGLDTMVCLRLEGWTKDFGYKSVLCI